MMRVSKKQIRQSVSESLADVVSRLEISGPSKKTNRLIRKVSRKFSAELKNELKKQFRKMQKASKARGVSMEGKDERGAISA